MSYKMTGPLQQAWDREDALGKAYFNDLTNIALANRAAEWAAAQEANRQAQLQDEYAFQDAQNAAARKQRAMENAMSGRRQVQHEYEFGKRLESDAANLAAQKEMEALRIGEQKAAKAEQQARQQQQDYFNVVGMATAGKVPWSVLEPVANDLPGDMPNQVRAAYGNMEQTRAQQQLATANALEPLNLQLKTIRENPIYSTPEMASVRDKALSEQIDKFKKEWNRVHRSMPFESVFQVTDGYEVFPTVSADTNYQFIQPKPGGRPGEFDVYPNFSQPLPQRPAPRTQQQTSAPVAEEPYSFWDLVKFANPFGQAARSLGGTRDRSQASDLVERQRTNAPVQLPAPPPTRRNAPPYPLGNPELTAAPERSSYSESAPLEVQGLPTPQLPPEDLVDKVRRLRAEQQARSYSDMPAFRELMAAREALTQQQEQARQLRAAAPGIGVGRYLPDADAASNAGRRSGVGWGGMLGREDANEIPSRLQYAFMAPEMERGYAANATRNQQLDDAAARRMAKIYGLPAGMTPDQIRLEIELQRAARTGGPVETYAAPVAAPLPRRAEYSADDDLNGMYNFFANPWSPRNVINQAFGDKPGASFGSGRGLYFGPEFDWSQQDAREAALR